MGISETTGESAFQQRRRTWSGIIIAIIKKLSISFPRNASLRIYKYFVRPHLDYADILYDKPNNESFKNKIENINNKFDISRLI